MTRPRRAVAMALVAFGAAAAALGIACAPSGAVRPVPSGALRGANLILVTIDTVRADHVGAYGSMLGLTPTLDRLAGEGLRFERTYAHVPMTLPSHTTIMTGLYPMSNGVRDNGSFRFDGTKATLAGALKAAGYRTGAFIGAFVLDARFGLNTGFDEYDDRMIGSGSNLEVVQRTAEEVLAPAGDWILSRTEPGRPPFFAWVHLYDPHEPYTPPEPYRSRYSSDPYSGEIAYADAALGVFLNRLRVGGALDHTLVVITSDHGESLGEHGERTHGLFAYDATLRVPLVLWAPGVLGARVIRQPARLVDVMPTILDLIGVDRSPAGQRIDGRSLRPFVGGEQPSDDPGSYFEALNANLTRNWAPLTGFVRNGLKVVDLPLPELYDLSTDPHELHNVYGAQRDRARDLETRLDGVIRSADSSALTPEAPDADAAARLRSLGYVVGPSARRPHEYAAADDPKRLVHLNAALDEATAAWSRGDGAHAIDILHTTLSERPDLTIAYERLAFVLRAGGRIPEAVRVLDEAAREGHANDALLQSLGEMLRDAGDLSRSASVLEAILERNAADLQTADALGQTYARMGRARDAEAMFRRVLAASPNTAATWNNLGSAYLAEGKTDDALDALSRAVALNPALATAHNGLGVAYAKAGQTTRAVAEWERALQLRPGYPDAAFNLRRYSR